MALRVQRLPRAFRNAGAPGCHVSPRAALVLGELVLEIVVDVDAPYAGRRLRVEHAQLAACEVDVFAVQRAELADA